MSCFVVIMRVEIDQSGRIEETNRDTVLALGNKDIFFSIRIPAKVKRQLKEIFRRQGKPRLFAIRTFAAAVVLLLRKSKLGPKIIVIDLEYPGHEQVIKDLIWESFDKEVEIEFEPIGKNSPAHEKAYFTYTKKLKEDRLIAFQEIAKIAIKNDRESLRT